ncbi:hypothetical protein H0264_09145 [Nocardia huaxiensis]|uniref:Mce-associated membrane protein n=1 Tax=Nocardia huaxiensis TaxID=2755382 RepID=A0A7D6VLB1_9NOCA|nr:hypothetical protein [Nocardia huaxiensis]QLY32396.1 hypothetical protein H0264_09145 [Nocardia huaxiensis]
MSEVELGKAAPETTESETTAGASEDTDATESSAPKRRFALPALGVRATAGLRIAAAAIVGASVASSVYFFLQNERSTELIDAREAARSAACNYAPLLATYDAKNLDAYFTAVLDGATGDWRTQFDSTSKDLREVLTQGQVVSKATDVQCGIRTSDESSAEAIVVIGQTITSLGTQNKPSPGQLSMVMRLEKQGDRWLVNKVNSPMAQQATP